MKRGTGPRLYERAKSLIPGGTQLLSKRPEMFLPGQWPAYYSQAKGCMVWDLDRRKFCDTSYMGIGACIIGYADPEVNRAVSGAIRKGSMSTLNPPEEVELARLLIRQHPWAAMARFARTGGEAMAVAIRIARAHTRRDTIIFCGYHGWHDWYLAANLSEDALSDGHLLPGLDPAGVPRGLKNTAITFAYNDLGAFARQIKKHRGTIAAVVMEPIRNDYPHPGFLETVRRVTAREKIVLVFDEITAGWRLCAGGAHMKLGVSPDIAVFAKAMSNGFPMAAVIGTGAAMGAAQKSFISSTYWTERIGPVAALATIRAVIRDKVPAHLGAIGRQVQSGWQRCAAAHGVKIRVSGIFPLGHFSFEHHAPLVLKTLFTQCMLDEGFLATNAFYASYAHKEGHVRGYLKSVDRAFRAIARAVKSGHPERFLRGPVCHAGFRRLN